MKQINSVFGIIALVFCNWQVSNAAIIYVDGGASGSNNGSSWVNAYSDLQDGLDNASSADEIRVAEGTYVPQYNLTSTTSTTTDRNNAFHIEGKDVAVSGGWDASTGTQTGGNTILSGDLSGNASHCYHVLVSVGQTRSTSFEYLVVINGQTNNPGCGSTSYGGQNVYSCSGGAVNHVNSSPSFVNCVFTDNQAVWGGVTVGDGTSGPSFTNCVFEDNTASSNGGVFHANNSGTSEFYNCTFIGNSGTAGGAIDQIGTGQSKVVNSLFYGNSGGTTPNMKGSLASGSVNNAADTSTGSLYNASTTTYVDLSSVSSSDLFKSYSDADGTDNKWMTSDDGFMPKDATDIITSGTGTGAPENDITNYKRRTTPSIGAFEGTECLSENVLPTGVDTTYTSSVATTKNSWTNYCAENGELLLSLKLGSTGLSVADANVQLKLGSSTTFSTTSYGNMITNTDGYAMVDRRWDVTSTGTKTSNPSVRYYFTSNEYSDVVTALGNLASSTTVTNVNQLQMYKATSGSAFADPHTVSGSVISYHASTSSTTQWTHSTHGTSDHIAEFEVASFSGGGGGASGGGGSPLPVELIAFNATTAPNHNANLSWTTASELNNSHFVVESSYDGVEFEEVTVVAGHGTSQQLITYTYTDERIAPTQNTVFYRLSQFDMDGTETISPTRRVQFDIQTALLVTKVFPNPSSGNITITFPEEEDSENHQIKISNHVGVVVKEFVTTELSTSIDMSKCSAGFYFISIDRGQTIKMIKE